jgi:sodium-independent sulfate anion transporter 11
MTIETLKIDHSPYHNDTEYVNPLKPAEIKKAAGSLATSIRNGAPEYFLSFVPSIKWLPKYNRRWLVGDAIAGLTVGAMVVPQSLAYAKLAGLPVEYGLYTGFVGVMLYAAFGTSREISVGPTAVLSLMVGTVVHDVTSRSNFTPVEVALALTFMSSLITLFLGIFRLGIVMDLIPNPVIIGFTTGSAFTIVLGQIATLLGIPNVSSNDSTHIIIRNIFVNLKSLNWVDLVFGLSAVTFLLLIAFASKRLSKRFRWAHYLQISSNAITVILFTLITYLVFLGNPKLNLKIVKTVPQGFRIGHVPIDPDLWSTIGVQLLPTTIVCILEHVALCKAFARQSGYQVDSSQEMFALGATNLVATFFSAYPATGSFSRSAVKSRSGVRTPFAGMWTGALVLMALGFLTPAFYYIPNPVLSAIIVTSASSLVTDMDTLINLYKVQPFDFLVCVVGILVTFFAGSEAGIGAAVGLSFLILLLRLARPQLYTLKNLVDRPNVYVDTAHTDHKTETTIPGVVIIKPQESLIFPNVDYFRDIVIDKVLIDTRSGAVPLPIHEKLWSEDLEARGEKLRAKRAKLNKVPIVQTASLPLLKAVIFDFSAVNQIDSSGLQGLFDLRDMLSKYAGADKNNSEAINIDAAKIQFNKEEVKAEAEKITEDFEHHIESPSSSITYEEASQFEFHFVTLHRDVQRVLELSKITTPISPILPVNFEYPENTPLVGKGPSKFVHLTVQDAVDQIKLDLDIFQRAATPARD